MALDGDRLAVSSMEEASSATGVGGDQTDNSAILAGAVYVFARSSTGTWTQEAYLKASNTDANDAFGRRLTLDANTLVVGAVGERSDATGIDGDQTRNAAFGVGAAYVRIIAP